LHFKILAIDSLHNQTAPWKPLTTVGSQNYTLAKTHEANNAGAQENKLPV